jgi:hypothetical protein
MKLERILKGEDNNEKREKKMSGTRIDEHDDRMSSYFDVVLT